MVARHVRRGSPAIRLYWKTIGGYRGKKEIVVSKALINGKDILDFVGGGISQVYRYKNLYVKIDGRFRYLQADKEVALWRYITPHDRKYFCKIVSWGPFWNMKESAPDYRTPPGRYHSWGYGDHESMYWDDIEEYLHPRFHKIMRRLCREYHIDRDMHAANYGIRRDNGLPIIWDWGLHRFPVKDEDLPCKASGRLQKLKEEQNE